MRFLLAFVLESDDTVSRGCAIGIPGESRVIRIDFYHLDPRQEDYLDLTDAPASLRQAVYETAAPVLAQIEVLAARWLGELRAVQREIDEPEQLAPLALTFYFTVDLSGEPRIALGNCRLYIRHGLDHDIKTLRSAGIASYGPAEIDAAPSNFATEHHDWAAALAHWDDEHRAEMIEFLTRARNAVTKLEAQDWP